MKKRTRSKYKKKDNTVRNFLISVVILVALLIYIALIYLTTNNIYG